MSSNIVSNKFIYARACTSISDDDHPSDSVLFPVECLRGFNSQVSSGICALFFENIKQYEPTVTVNTSYIFLTITAGTEKEVSETLVNEIAFGDKPIIVIADDVTGEYFPGITAVFGIAQDMT